MSYKIEAINGCMKKFIFHYDQLDLSSEINKVLREKQRTVSLKGFRPGKAPMSMVEQFFAQEATQKALHDFATKTFFEVIETEKVRMVGFPVFSKLDIDENKKVDFEIIVEFLPEIQLTDIDKLDLQKVSADVTEEDYISYKNNYLNSKSVIAEVVDPLRAVKNQDLAIIKMEAKSLEGEEIAELSRPDFSFYVDDNFFIPGFATNLIDMKKGEKKHFEFTLPEKFKTDYNITMDVMAFDIELLEIKERKIPECTDENIKEWGFDDATAFESHLRKTLTETKQDEAKNQLEQQIIQKLLEKHQFDVPVSLVRGHKEELRRHYSERIQNMLQYADKNKKDELFNQYMNQAEGDLERMSAEQIKVSILLGKIAETYSIKVDDEDLEERYVEVAKRWESDVASVKQLYAQHENKLNALRHSVEEQKVLKKIIELNNIA